jgi:hypothetical protein
MGRRTRQHEQRRADAAARIVRGVPPIDEKQARELAMRVCGGTREPSRVWLNDADAADKRAHFIAAFDNDPGWDPETYFVYVYLDGDVEMPSVF